MLKKEVLDGPSLGKTQQYIKEKLETIMDGDGISWWSAALGVGVGMSVSSNTQVSFDSCNATFKTIQNDYDNAEYRDANIITKCDFSKAKVDNSYDIKGNINLYFRDIDCYYELKYRRHSYGILFDSFEDRKPEKETTNRFILPLSRSNFSLNKKLVKAFEHYVELCNTMKPKREIKDKDDLF